MRSRRDTKRHFRSMASRRSELLGRFSFLGRLRSGSRVKDMQGCISSTLLVSHSLEAAGRSLSRCMSPDRYRIGRTRERPSSRFLGRNRGDPGCSTFCSQRACDSIPAAFGAWHFRRIGGMITALGRGRCGHSQKRSGHFGRWSRREGSSSGNFRSQS